MKPNVLIIAVVQPVERAQDTGKGGGIFSKTPTKSYSDGWDRIFGKTQTSGPIVGNNKLN
jgi:hypothetical protein